MEGENNNNNENNMEWEAARAEPAPDEPRVNDDHDPPQNVEQDDQLPRNNDGSLNGGVAVPPESNKVRAAECELVSTSRQYSVCSALCTSSLQHRYTMNTVMLLET